MNLQLDISLNTLLVTTAVGVVGFALKKTIEIVCDKLVSQLIETSAQVAIAEEKMNQLTDKVGDVEKLRRDLNNCFTLYRELRADLDKK